MHFLIRFFQLPEVLEARLAAQADHIAFRQGLGKRAILAGPLLADEGGPPTGSLIILDADDPAEARKIAEADPFVAAGVLVIERIDRMNVMAINPPSSP